MVHKWICCRKVAALTNRTAPSAEEQLYPFTNAVFLLSTAECAWARNCHTVPATNRDVPDEIQALMPEIVQEATWQIYAIFNDTQVKKYVSGPLLRDLMVGFDAVVNAQEGSRKFILYSGHDLGPMMNIWAALGARAECQTKCLLVYVLL